ncbi:MAG: peptidylprolyl isomerase [bacterium]|nr:peptidylprolyl isomerase [bacterium]
MASDHKTLSGKHTVVMKTSKGDITLELDADAAPKTVSNFVVHAQNGYYDDLIFHRVIPDFMIQGGDPDGNGTGGVSIYGDTFEDEINAKTYKLHKKKLSEEVGSQPLPDEMKDLTVMEYNEMMGYVYNDDLKSLSMERGVIAMANRGPNTNGSQFFLITREGGTPWLEGKHTVFGKITDGMDVIDAIQIVSRDGSDKPFDDVTFSVEVQ